MTESKDKRTGQFGIAMNTLNMQDSIVAAGGPIPLREAEYRVITFNRKLQEMLGEVLLRTVGKQVEVKIKLRVDSQNLVDMPSKLTVELLQDFFERAKYRECPYMIAYQVTVLLVNWWDAEIGDFVVERAIVPLGRDPIKLWVDNVERTFVPRTFGAWERIE